MSAEFVALAFAFDSDAQRYVGTLFPQLQVRVGLAKSRAFELYRTDASWPAAEAIHRLCVHERPPWQMKAPLHERNVDVETPWLTPRALEAYLIFTYPQWFRLAA